jgi:hypothetical protein
MSGDFENWNNQPSKTKAPPANASFVGAKKAKRTARIFVWIGGAVGISLLGWFLWYISTH